MMVKNIFKIVLISVLLGVSTLVHAIESGEWSIIGSPGMDQPGMKPFSICIQKDGNWYISSVEAGWKGKWVTYPSPGIGGAYNHLFVGKEDIILQALYAQEGRMKSLFVSATDPTTSKERLFGEYIELAAPSGTIMGAYDVMWSYKGTTCAPYPKVQAGQQHKGTDTVGLVFHQVYAQKPWVIGTLRKKEALHSCVATITGPDGSLTVSLSADRKQWQLTLPKADIQAGVKLMQQYNGDKQEIFAQGVSINPVDGSASIAVDSAWARTFFDTAEDENGKARFRDYRIGDGRRWMKWKLTEVDVAFETLQQCIDLHGTASDVWNTSQMTGLLSNELTGPDTCLTLEADGHPYLLPCASTSPSVWQAWLSNQASYDVLKTKEAGSKQCLTLDTTGALFMRTCDFSDAQNWQFLLWPGDGQHYHVQNKMAGKKWCLGILQDNFNNKVNLSECANYADQAWLIREH